MKSITTIYRIGPGPSSSHTLALKRACDAFKEKYPNIKSINATLVGSLALTGKGHFSDTIIQSCFLPLECPVDFQLEWDQSYPHGFTLNATLNTNEIVTWHIFSVGGGAFEVVEAPELIEKDVYDFENLNELNRRLKLSNKSYAQYILEKEPTIINDLRPAYEAMKESVANGLSAGGYVRGNLKVKRCGAALYCKALQAKDPSEAQRLKVMAYAFAVAEENACGKQVVTSPTLGSCGVMASLVYHYNMDLGYSDEAVIEAMAVAGLFGNIARYNATVSGAVGGCQAEIGVACAMGAAFVNALLGCSNIQVEIAAEVAMEHHLGLTCDPIDGYVVVPCIERNSQAALRSIDAALLARNISDIRDSKVSFDEVIHTMKYTGQKLPKGLKETSLGGLAKIVVIRDHGKDISYD